MKFLVFSENYVKDAIELIHLDSNHPGFRGKLNLAFHDTTLETDPFRFTEREAHQVLSFFQKFSESGLDCCVALTY